MTAICIPEHIANDLPIEAVRAAFASLGLVIDGRLGADRTLIVRWASDAVHDQRCREPGCPRLPTILVDGAPYCALHGRRRLEESCP